MLEQRRPGSVSVCLSAAIINNKLIVVACAGADGAAGAGAGSSSSGGGGSAAGKESSVDRWPDKEGRKTAAKVSECCVPALLQGNRRCTAGPGLLW